MKRPMSNGLCGAAVTTPTAATMMQLLGGMTHGDVALTHDQRDAIARLYDFRKEPTNKRPPRPSEPSRETFERAYDYDRAMDKHKAAVAAWERWEDPRVLMQAGADRNMMQYAEADGLRIVAYLARFLAPGDDPLKALVPVLSEAGWDVDPGDFAWATDETEEEASDDGAEAPTP